MKWKWNIIRQTNDLMVIRLSNTLTKNFVRWNDIFENFTNKIFITSFINILLKSNPFEEYYIEFNPTTFDMIDSVIFEFVLIKTTGFSLKADIITFGVEKINTNSNKIIWFPNPSNSAILVVPCFNNLFPIDDYIHIGTFMRSSNIKQKLNLVQSMFKIYFNELALRPNKKLWLSTHGKGVGWLHIRIDKMPKYITNNPYK
jgi:hypothetical protein